MTNDINLTFLKGIGEKKAALYRKLGIHTAEELVAFYPKDYIDYTDPKPICSLENDELCVFEGKVTKKLKPYLGRISVFRAAISDGTDELILIFFNTAFTFDKLIEGQSYLFYGKIACDFAKKECSSPLFIPKGSKNRLVSKYSLTKGLSSAAVSSNVKTALKALKITDFLPEYIREKENLMSLDKALFGIHFPESSEELEGAKKRLAFEELLVLQLGLSLIGKKKRLKNGASMQNLDITEFFSSLSFKPTNAQKRAVTECLRDMCSSLPMNRLLQGDVGSGKTLVAAAAIYFAVKNGYQASLMVPTEILARQHRDSLAGFLEPLGIKIELLTGSLSEKEKKEVRERIKSGEARVITGTQALIQKNTVFSKLGLSVVDEQHRFGSEQRSKLQMKGENPHNLVMSATPIPRTLALMIYADLDISILDEMPKGRLPIKTYAVDSSYHKRLYEFIRKYVNDGYQAYIVCPLVEEGLNDKTAAVKYFEELRSGALSGISMGLLHGKMKQNDKDLVMAEFKENKLSVLVSTTVIEVGVDVPNAVIMIIENSERFGLSQLHQLRGRVGRGSVQSHCVLVSDSKSQRTKARIEIMVKTSDGFEIANKDLELRGPGDFFGAAQHGLPALKIADMTRDIETVRLAQKYSEEILKEDEKLICEKNRGLRELVKKLFKEGERYGIN